MSEPIKDVYRGIRYEVNLYEGQWVYTISFHELNYIGSASHPLDAVIAAKRKIEAVLREEGKL